MGQTIKTLAKKQLPGKPIFNNRFVIEVCEKIHVHYRNLRLMFDITDFLKFAEGIKNSVLRWQKRGNPSPDKRNHIELCRHRVAQDDDSDDVQINLNKNLYKQNEGRIFAEGADLEGDLYIHLKIRDIRVELTIEEFKVIAGAFKDAEKRIQDGDISAMLQKTRVHEEVRRSDQPAETSV